MKAIKFAGLVAILLAPMAMATTADVTWTPRGSAANYNGDVTFDMANIQPADLADCWISWTQSVRITGDNQGLAGYVLDMGVKNVATGTYAPHPFNDGSDGSRYWSPVFKTGAAGNGVMSADGSYGGPGLSTLPMLGTQKTDPISGDTVNEAYLMQFGAGLLTFTPFVKTKTGWTGAQTWGVGLDSRKATLLGDAQGTYDGAAGYFSLEGWAPGTYKVELIVKSTAVLKSGLNLNAGAAQSGVTEDVVLSSLHGESFEFTIVPEPATLLLLAGAGLLYRRRHA